MAVVAVVLFCLFRPTLIVRAAVPQQNVVAVLLDDSRSMQVPDWGGQPRANFVRQQFGAATSPVVKALSERFLVRTFRFSSTATRAEAKDSLTFNGSQTRLAPSLDSARNELAGLPVSGVVLVSDGADTSDVSLTDALLGLKAQKLPVFTVGVGSAKPARDIQQDGHRRCRRRGAHRRLPAGAVAWREHPRHGSRPCRCDRRRSARVQVSRHPSAR
jgi:hypothetical protein